jgi:hypothetical protein
MAQDFVALVQSIGTATMTAKAVGVGIGRRFLDGVETQQIQSLHGSIR